MEVPADARDAGQWKQRLQHSEVFYLGHLLNAQRNIAIIQLL